jgi:sugar phosphate isomerase/epimerase
MHTETWTPVTDAPGKIGLDILLAETDPKFVFLEMDIYWAYTGVWENGLGTTVDPVDYLEAFPERFPLFHVKDGHYAARSGGATLVYNQDNLPRPFQSGMTDVHQGDIDFRTMFSRLSKVSDLSNHYFLWERDTANQHPHGSMSSARASCAAMRYDHMAGPAKY